jgi:hypothetical protein
MGLSSSRERWRGGKQTTQASGREDEYDIIEYVLRLTSEKRERRRKGKRRGEGEGNSNEGNEGI